MYFKRKVYDKLLEWKNNFADHYAVILEGARRVGKSTLARNFSEKEYKSYIMLDFSKITDNIRNIFDDIGNLNMFFLRLQAETGVKLFEHESIVIFDEVQLFPKARQAIKHLVADGRYHYLETGSLISIKKNVKDILIPSEEMKIEVFPMDYEEFCLATNNNYDILKEIAGSDKGIGQNTNRKLMRDLRIYMAVGGMPQAVDAYVRGDSFSGIDNVKRQIIRLYEEDFKKIEEALEANKSKMKREVRDRLADSNSPASLIFLYKILTKDLKERAQLDGKIIIEEKKSDDKTEIELTIE